MVDIHPSDQPRCAGVLCPTSPIGVPEWTHSGSRLPSSCVLEPRRPMVAGPHRVGRRFRDEQVEWTSLRAVRLAPERGSSILKVMANSVEDLAQEVLALPPEARVALVDRLVQSLDPLENEELRRLWAAEALRRRDEVRSGQVQTVSAEAVADRVRQRLHR